MYSPWLNPYVTGSQRKDLTVDFSKFDQEVISEVRAADQGIPLISVLFTGRPVPIANIYEKSTSVIAAWLPGTSGGQAVVNLITGEYIARANGSSDRKNTLSMDWPRNMVIVYLFRNHSKISLSIKLMGLYLELLMLSLKWGMV